MASSTPLGDNPVSSADAAGGVSVVAGRTRQAQVVEVFSSIQGEGSHIGCRHIFVRFFACNLRCNYCDTPESLTGTPRARLEVEAGQGNFEICDNPITEESLMSCITRLAQNPHDAVSLTGGEPLLQKDFLRSLCPQIRALGLGTFLETNGTLPEHLRAVIHCIDTVSMDIKLPETLRNGQSWFDKHREFLRIALQTEVYAKLVLPAAPNWSAVEKAAKMIASVDSTVLLVIQPVTPSGSITESPSSETIVRTFDIASKHLSDVRVIPQVHKMIGLR